MVLIMQRTYWGSASTARCQVRKFGAQDGRCMWYPGSCMQCVGLYCRHQVALTVHQEQLHVLAMAMQHMPMRMTSCTGAITMVHIP